MQIRHLLPLLAVLFLGAAKKPPLSIRFHLQAQKQEGESFVMKLPLERHGLPATIYVKKIPEVTENEVREIYPFQAADGTMGCALKLDEHGRIDLDTCSVENRGKVLVCLVNLRVVTAMIVDRRVPDGIITIPSGLTDKEIAMMKKRFPILGAKKKAPKPENPLEASRLPTD